MNERIYLSFIDSVFFLWNFDHTHVENLLLLWKICVYIVDSLSKTQFLQNCLFKKFWGVWSHFEILKMDFSSKKFNRKYLRSVFCRSLLDTSWSGNSIYFPLKFTLVKSDATRFWFQIVPYAHADTVLCSKFIIHTYR